MAAEAARRGAGALICIPTYNEADNIERIVPAVLEAVPEAAVLVIDDASPDGTGGLADALAAADPRVFVLHRAGKEGLGPAYLAGFAWALARDYKFIFEFDADFSHRPEYLPGFMEALTEVDVVVGSRRVPGGGIEDWSAPRRLLSWGGSLYARAVLGVGLRDLTGGFNAFRREVLEGIGLGSLQTTGYAFQVELKYRCLKRGYRVRELPIIFPDRVAGRSKMGGHIIGEAMWMVLKLRFGGGRGEP